MPPCHWCGLRPAFKRSHVVSDFIIRWLKGQSIQQAVYYSWAETFKSRDIVGPYFCRDCDNHVIGAWETEFSQDVFPDPMAATHEWGLDTSVKFIVSLCYRYAMHNLRVSPHGHNAAFNEEFRDIARATLLDTNLLGSQLFVYPYVYRPITTTCSLRPGVNHFLSLAIGSRPHHAEGTLPGAMEVQIPRILFLFARGDLTQTGDNAFAGYVHLTPGAVFHPDVSNINMPEVFAHYINRGIIETKRHLSGWGLWGRINRWLLPQSAIHAVTSADQQLIDRQRQNCQTHSFA
jgi:hypothetical protein